MTDRLVRRARAGSWSIRVDEIGTGATTYVLLHGYGVTPRYLRPTATILAETGRVLMPTMPGWRGSDRPRPALDVNQLADALIDWIRSEQLPPVVLVANSFGCQVAAALAVRAPELVHSMVLTGPTVEPGARSFHRMIARLFVNTVREPIRLGGIIALDYGSFGPRNCVAMGRIAIHHHLEDVLPHVGVPTLVVRGARDGLLTRAWAERCAAVTPDGQFAEIDGGSHAVNYNSPSALAALVQDFERQLVPAPLHA